MPSYQQALRKRQLPSGYLSIDDILAEKVPMGRLVSVIGLVKDHQAPIPTKGNDYKCAYTIYDDSVEDNQVDLTFSMFGKKDDMPQPSAGDVLVISSAKLQSFRGSVSLISNKSMSIHIYSASHIPRPPRSAEDALNFSYGSRKPGEKEHEYVSWLWHHVNKDSIPDAVTFQKKVGQSGHTKDKFCKLENVVEGMFCDVIVNVVKEPFCEVEKTTLWVSDYTENEGFHKFSWDGGKRPHDGDSGGYLNTHVPTATKWAGPFGKRSMQVTCFEPHASHVNSEVQLGQWIRIPNLRIKLGNNGLNLEGALHGNRGLSYSEIDFRHQRIDILKYDGAEYCDLHLKEAIRRKKNYEKLMKTELRSFVADENGANATSKGKPGHSEEPKLNSKARRKERRAAAEKKVEEQDKQAESRLGLNDLIKCESPEQPVTPVPSLMKPVLWETTIEGEAVTLELPFTCAKYRIYARVVDFRPQKLENFAIWRKSTESDVLSDYSSGSDSGFDDQNSTQDRSSGQKVWEWRFVLQLEDADPTLKGEKEKFWAVVDNTEAQQLTGLDACDLRERPDTLAALREKLFKLWGNLEEAKLHEQQRQIMNKRRVATHQPPPSSPNDVEEYQEREIRAAKQRDQNASSVSNKPFACCIRQYGVRIREPDPSRADAGEGLRWARIFGLYGTKISG
ncbi:hypothetical protein F4861DRAFT_491678 [Xylaria intraflava]|nr:hypothetical protein F4861DRAFT_491678 [Xylaria intraflava]